MKEDVKRFLDSSLLEEYVLGSIDPARIPEVENYILNFPEVKKIYDELQENIALLGQKLATAPPAGTKENILREIDEIISNEPITTPTVTGSSSLWSWAAAAASIAAVALGIWSFSLSQENNALQKEASDLKTQYASLQEECEDKKAQYAQQEAQWMILADAKTQKYLINGNEKAAQLSTVAYLNKESKSSYLRILSLPELPQDKCFQLWADVDGKMVSLKILPKETDQIVAIPFKNNATSLNITIEPKDGSAHPTIANLVASVSI